MESTSVRRYSRQHDDATQFLQQIENGDRSAAEHLLPLVYDELRNYEAAQMAAEVLVHMLQATTLVNEAHITLAGDGRPKRNSRGHFFAGAAEGMRPIRVKMLDEGSGSRSVANCSVVPQ